MTLAALTFRPDEFDAGVDIFGISNWHRTVQNIPPWWESMRAALEREMGDNPTADQIKKKAELLAELEWVMAQEKQQPGREPKVEMRKPCYFNTGCGSFSDGDITGIEIAEGKIRLIRWPDKNKKPKPYVLVEEPLRDVFGEL